MISLWNRVAFKTGWMMYRSLVMSLRLEKKKNLAGILKEYYYGNVIMSLS